MVWLCVSSAITSPSSCLSSTIQLIMVERVEIQRMSDPEPWVNVSALRDVSLSLSLSLQRPLCSLFASPKLCTHATTNSHHWQRLMILRWPLQVLFLTLLILCVSRRTKNNQLSSRGSFTKQLLSLI